MTASNLPTCHPILCFAETPSQAAAALACGYPVTIVAITPIVDYWAEKVECPILGIEGLFDERLHRELGSASIDRVEALVAAIDSVLQKTVPRWPFADALSFAAFFHYTNGTLDSIVLRLEQLMGACDVLTPKTLVAFRPRGIYSFSGITSLDHAPWGLVTHLVPQVAASRGIEVRWLDAPDDDPSVYNPVRDFAPDSTTLPISPTAPPIRTNRALQASARWLRARFRGIAPRFLSVLSRVREQKQGEQVNEPLLISSLFADLGDGVLESWARLGGRVMDMNHAFPVDCSVITREQAAISCEVLWEMLHRDSKVRELLLWKGVDLWPFFAPWLRQVIKGVLPSLFQRAGVVWKRLIDDSEYRNAVFVAGGWVADHYVIARLAQRVGLPTVSCHYGGFLGFSLLPKHERYDFAECDYFLCGGEGAERVFRKPSPQARWNPAVKRAKPVPTGIPWASELPTKVPKNTTVEPNSRRRIMLVLNALLGDCRDLGFVFPPETEYWRFTRKVIELLAEKLDVDIVIKPPLRCRYPQMPNPLLDWIKDQRLHRVTVVGDTPLKDCLDLADAYILESPSTPLLQVAATNKPLLLYINRHDYLLDPEAAAALCDRAVVFAQTEAEFIEKLKSFLDLPNWSTGLVNDRFLREFVVGEATEEPACRIAKFLRSLTVCPA